MNAHLYHLATNGNVTGPFAPEQIRGMWKNGTITADAQICLVGSEIWKPAASIIGLKSDGNLTKLGFIGIGLFTAMATPALLMGNLIATIIGSLLLLLAALCWFKARSVTARALTWRGPAYVAACVAAGLGIYAWTQHRAEAARIQAQQRQAEIKAIVESDRKDFWFKFYEGSGPVPEDSPFAKEWNASLAGQ